MVDGPGALSGRTLGGYRLGARLARSPHAEVYRAADDDLGREVVIKLVPGGAASAAARERFLAEARVAARIDHPYATHVYASGVEADGTCWMAMEHVRGATLTERVARHGPLPLAEAIDLASRLAEVVSTLHDQGLVHLDLKPDNVMVVARGGRLLPRLCDFGLAAVPLDAPAGTPAYMAPEQWLLGTASAPAVGPPADIYALALCVHFALTGAHAFDSAAASPSASGSAIGIGTVAAAHARAARPRLPAPFPAALADALVAALAVDPAARPASALELAASLRAAIDARARPRFDDAVVEAVLAGAPEPIAEAMAAWEAATSTRAELDALDDLHLATARWLGLCAIALRRTHGLPPAGVSPHPAATAALAALACGAPSAADWLALARDDTPVNDLAIDLDRASRLSMGAPRHGDDLERRVTATLVAVQRLLRAASAVITPRLVVRRGARVERWSGVRRRKRPAIWVASAEALLDGVPTIVDEQGAPLIALDGLAMLDAPATGEADEIFVLGAGDGDASIYVASPTGYQRRVAGSPLGLAAAAGARDERDDRGPYPGLAPFTSDDAAWFVGREREVEDCANKLRDRPLLVVVGPSGVGKSSFVLAGVAPASGAAHVVVCRPGDAPATALLAALSAIGPAHPRLPVEVAIEGEARTAAPDHPPTAIASDHRTDQSSKGAGNQVRVSRATDDPVRSTIERVEALAADGRVLIVIDQLEEAATRATAAQAAILGEIVDELARLAARGVDVRVLATVRDDFLVRAASATGLGARVAAGVVLLGPPDEAALVRIVTEPAARAGYGFDDPALPAQMVAAVTGAASPLPLLSFAARALWTRRDRKLRQLRRRDHDAIGGVLGALARHADETVDGMNADARALVRPLLASLATAEGARVPVARADLIELLGGGPAAAHVIERLVDARLLVSRQHGDLAQSVTDAAKAGADEIELVHEALLGAWPRLAAWRRDDAVAAQLRDAIRTAAQQWDARGRGRDLLWRGEALDELRIWQRRHRVKLTARDQAFCDASLREARRRRRLLRGALIAGALAAALTMLVLVRANREARSQRAAATTARARAVESADTARARLIDSLVEQGRTAALDDRPREALAWLDAALDAGADPAPLERLIAITANTLGEERARPVFRTPVHVMTWSRDAEYLAVGGRIGDGRVVVLGRDGSTVAQLPDAAATVTDLAFAPATAPPATPQSASSGRTAALPMLAIAAGRARVWRPGAGDAAVDLPGDAARVRWSPDGARLATAGRDGVVRVFVSPLWHEPALEIAPRGGVQALVSVDWLDGERVIVGDRQRGLRVYEVMSGRLLAEHAADAPVLDVRVHGDAVITLPFDAPTADYWEPGRRKQWRLSGQTRPLDAVALHGSFAAGGGADGTVMVWDLVNGQLKATHVGHRGGVSAVGFVGETVISGGGDGTVRVWAETTPTVRHAHPVGITAMGVPDEGPARDLAPASPTVFATGAADGSVAMWTADDLAAMRSAYTYDAATALVVDGDRWITVAPGRVETWPDRRPLPLSPPTIGEGPLRVSHRVDAARSDDGHLVVPDGDAAAILDRNGDVTDRCTLGAPVTTVAISRDGATIAAAGHDGVVAVCRGMARAASSDATSGPTPPSHDPRRLPTRGGAIWTLAFSPDGAQLAIGGAALEVSLVDLTTDHIASARLGAGTTSLAWTPRGDQLAAATLDGGLAVIARDGTITSALPGSGTQANAVAVLDDRHVALGLDDGTVIIISRDLGRPIARWSLGAAVLSFAVGASRGQLIAVLPDHAVELPLGAPLTPTALHALARCRAHVEVRGGRLVQATPDCT